MLEVSWSVFKEEVFLSRKYKETARYKIAYYEDEINIYMFFKLLDHDIYTVLSKEVIYASMKGRNISSDEAIEVFKMENLTNSIRLLSLNMLNKNV